MRKPNENQMKAIAHNDGAMMVLAGPGSGKTTVILERTKRLIELGHKGILVMTFTKATADEMKERFSSHNSNNVLFSTFHGLFFRILRSEYGYTFDHIIADDEKRQVLLKMIEKMNTGLDHLEERVQQFITQYSYMQNTLTKEDEFLPMDMDRNIFLELLRGYKKYKSEQKKIDFDDMLTLCYELFLENEVALSYWRDRFTYIMVDEFQDINRVQYECVRLLAAPKNNLLVVGDDDQSIYGFRGASPSFLLEFERLYENCERVILNENYRSHKGVLMVADGVIFGNTKRHEKNLKSMVRFSDIDAVKILVNKDSVAESKKIADKIREFMSDGVPPKEIAIIYRINTQAGAFIRELRRQGLPYLVQDTGLNIYDHWIAKDLLAYLMLAESTENDSALLRILNKPTRYLSKDFIAEAQSLPKTLFENFYVAPSLKKWQLEKIEQLLIDLRQVEKRNVYEALRYIRKIIGYDTYLEDYAAYRKMSPVGLFEIIDELTEIAKEVTSAKEYEQLLEDMAKEMKDASKKKQKQEDTDAVRLMTMHASKGLEFTAVFLPTLIQDVMPHKRNQNIAEERRLLYVGITRAKKILYLSTLQERYGEAVNQSIFLDELNQRLAEEKQRIAEAKKKKE
ncbi:MAG: ATP-dependent helicase [Bacillota bacterium]